MMLAFTCIYWGTHDLSWSRAFEISVSSLTTMGFAEPNGTGRIWIAFVEATIGLGLVALLISYLPTIYSAYNGREKGTNRLRPVAGSPPGATGVPPEPAAHGQPREPRLLAGTPPTGCSTSSRRTRRSRSSRTSPRSDIEQSWVATVGTVLDASALVFAVSEIDVGRESSPTSRRAR